MPPATPAPDRALRIQELRAYPISFPIAPENLSLIHI